MANINKFFFFFILVRINRHSLKRNFTESFFSLSLEFFSHSFQSPASFFFFLNLITFPIKRQKFFFPLTLKTLHHTKCRGRLIKNSQALGRCNESFPGMLSPKNSQFRCKCSLLCSILNDMFPIHIIASGLFQLAYSKN